MKSLVRSLFVIFVLLPAALFSDDGQFALTPSAPKIGDRVTLTYNAASRTASLRDVKEITGEVMLVKLNTVPELVEVPLKAEGSVWSGSFNLSNKDAALILIRFVSGDLVDDNGANVWDAIVYGADGRPVRNAHLLRFNVLRSGSWMDFKKSRDPDAARRELAEEEKAYPDNLTATTYRWGSMMREAPGDSVRTIIRNELERMYEADKGDDGSVAMLLTWFNMTGQTSRGDSLRAAAKAANPRGKIAFSEAEQAVFAERNAKKRIPLIEKLIADFTATDDEKETRLGMLANACASAGEPARAIEVLGSMRHPPGLLYNNIAWDMIDSGADVKKGVACAKTGIGILRNTQPESKPSYMSQKKWDASIKENLGLIIDTYGFGLFKLGRFEEAASAYEEATSLTAGKHSDITGRLIQCERKLGRTNKVFEIAESALRTGNAGDSVLVAFRDAYVKKNGSDRDFDATVAGLKAEASKKARAALLKERVNKPAVDFTLRSLDGKTVKLSDLRGKVVVVDFWATWCGPCKSSFPYLQKVVDKYRGNERVVFLTIDTWENVTGKERETLVRKFIDDNRYTFPVLFDEGFVEKYGVDGIPTKFLIDRNGMIQFRKIGAEGEEMITGLSAQIDLLLGEEFYSM